MCKGILRAGDAKLAVQHGARGVVVSNHGGRQLDGAVPAITALPEVVAAVGGTSGGVPVLLDTSIRSGAQVGFLIPPPHTPRNTCALAYVYQINLEHVRDVCMYVATDEHGDRFLSIKWRG
eukprot:COSAG01_NODE_1060_length_11890_cov_17.763973_4_plen_121_part_00